MKVLIVTRGYFPAKTYGGPPVSIQNICMHLSDLLQFYIICCDHELGSKKRLENINSGWNKYENCSVLYLADNSFNIKKLTKVVQDVNPSVIYLNSLFDYKRTLPFLLVANRLHISTLIAPRGELCINAFDGKYKKIPYIFLLYYLIHKKNIYFQSTSIEETEGIMHWLRIDKDRIFEMSNFPSPMPLYRTSFDKEEGECHIVFISRIQKKKNLLYSLQLLKEIKYTIYYDIYGPIEEPDYWEQCKEVISSLPSNIKVDYKGILNHEEVARVFSQYHVFLFTTFSENYGHVIAEALSQQCIVITSDQVPWTDLEEYKAGWALPLTDKHRFLFAINEVAEMDNLQYLEKLQYCKAYANKRLNIDALKKQYINFFEYVK